MANSFWRKVGHFLGFPFAYMHNSIGLSRINRKAERYINNPEDFEKVRRYDDSYKLAKGLLYLLNVDVQVRGVEHLLKKPMFIVPNHKSNLDPIVMGVILYELKGFPYFNFVAKKELLEDKYSKGILKMLDSILIDRDNLRDVVKVINTEIERLKENTVVCFLEGTRVHGDQIGEIKAAGLEPAYKSLAPIIPTVIYGTDGALDENDKHKTKYKRVIVEFLEPVKHTSYGKESKEYFSEKLHKRLQDGYDKIKAEFVQEDKTNKAKEEKDGRNK